MDNSKYRHRQKIVSSSYSFIGHSFSIRWQQNYASCGRGTGCILKDTLERLTLTKTLAYTSHLHTRTHQQSLTLRIPPHICDITPLPNSLTFQPSSIWKQQHYALNVEKWTSCNSKDSFALTHTHTAAKQKSSSKYSHLRHHKKVQFTYDLTF